MMELTMSIKTQVRDYVAAVRDYPKGVLCGWCRRPNFFFDDCGWICITPDGYGKDRQPTKCAPCCERCWRGPLGKKHISHFGLGDR